MNNYDYHISFTEGKFNCNNCGKKFLMFYEDRGPVFGNSDCTGIAKANFFRHLRSCYKKKPKKMVCPKCNVEMIYDKILILWYCKKCQ